jgi:hypothetical protein
MSINNNIDELLRALDPLTSEQHREYAQRRNAIWADVVSRAVPARPRARRRRRIIGAGSLGAVAAAALLFAGILPGTAPLSAAAADLTSAAQADAGSAALPALAAGQYYYQESAVSMVCQFGSPSMPANEPSLTYVSDGTIQSWTSADGSGQVVITPSPVGANGSHFATAQDETRWVALGKPFNPCALADSSNNLPGNPANVNPTPYGGYATSMSGYSGFGFTMAWAASTSQLASGTSVNNLPDSVAQIASMLANGEINTDGSVSATPQVCPYGGNGSAVGCTTTQQLQVIEQLLQLPDASAKLGSVLYQVMAQMPGASVVGAVSDPLGRAGEGIVVPVDQTEEFEVILDPVTGTLLSCAALVASDSNVALSQPSTSGYAPVAQVTDGPISVVQGVGTLPSSQ